MSDHECSDRHGDPRTRIPHVHVEGGPPTTSSVLPPLPRRRPPVNDRVMHSPNAPRPDDPLTLEVADMLRRIEQNYEREGSGPGSRFEGRLPEDVQAEAVVRHIAAAERDRLALAAGSREALGALVREVWVQWAREQPDPKPSWLTPFEELDEGQREVDMRIGEVVASAVRERLAAKVPMTARVLRSTVAGALGTWEDEDGESDPADAVVAALSPFLGAFFAHSRDTAAERADGPGLITAERRRQIGEEGWTPGHDDRHDAGQLARAGACYALYGAGIRTLAGSGVLGRGWPWPWDVSGFKPDEDPIRTLVKAGALIAAEIDRLIRQQPTTPEETRPWGWPYDGTHHSEGDPR